MTKPLPIFDKARSSQLRLLRPDFRYISLYLVLPNFAFFAIGQFAFLVRPIVVVDYVVICLVSPFISRRSILILIAVFSFLDLGFSVAPAYHMQGLDFARNAYAVFLMSWPILLITIGFVFTIGLSLFLLFANYLTASSRITPRNVKAVLIAAFFLLTIDVINGSNIFIPSKFNLVNQNIAGGYLHKLVLESLKFIASGTTKPIAPHFIDVNAGTAGLRNMLTLGKRPLADKILLVVVESYGVPVSRELQHIFAEPFNRDLLKSRYEVRFGEVSFSGSTVSGEVRELCGQGISSPSDVDYIPMTDCLPNLLKLRGYKTTAVHGFSRYMFDRQSWYPRIGFESMLFFDGLEAEGYSNRCGHVFRGSCDSDVAVRVQNLLSPTAGQGGGTRQFVYWLTLNSHLPVARDTSIERDMDCTSMLDLDDHEEHEEACRLSRVLLGTLHSIADIAEKSYGGLHVIIVGDHAPPFVWQKDRSLFKPGVVPFVELISKVRGG